jgi:hypothetical protein
MIMTVLAGFAGGLAGTLWGGIVSSAWLARDPAARALGWQVDTSTRVLVTAVLYGACGAAAGFLFWLGWGLAAFTVGTAWHVVGLTYGALLWSAVAVPALLLLALRLPALRRVCAVMAAEAFVATLAMGLFCAFVWHRAA